MSSNPNGSYWFFEEMDITGIMCPKKMMSAGNSYVHKVYKKGEYIYLPDEFADRIFLVSKGRVKIGTYSENGKEITKSILNMGEVFGELALVGAAKRRDFAVAMEPTELCMMTVQEMKEMMKEHTGLGLFLMQIFGSRKLEMERRLESLVFKDSRSRIVEYLKYLGETKGKRVGYEMLVRKFLTHQEIANMTATSRQTVTTVLNELRTNNIITFNRKRLLIRDMEKLV